MKEFSNYSVGEDLSLVDITTKRTLLISIAKPLLIIRGNHESIY